jgi:hypothetical protein
MQQHFSPANPNLYYENVAQSSGIDDTLLDAQVGNHPTVSPQDPDFGPSGAPSTTGALRASATGRVIPSSLALEAQYLVGETGDDENAFELGNLTSGENGEDADDARFTANV